MALYRKWTSTILVNGQPEPNVKVYVFSPGSTDQIPIYEDEGITPIAQPILTDSQGRYAFFVDVDTYPEIRLYLEKDGVDFSEANEDLDGVPVPGASAAAGTFLALSDTPSSYVGRGGDVVLVKTTEDGIETQPWPVTGTILNFFLSDDAADIGSYYYMYPTESGNGYSELTSPSLSTGDDQLLWSFVTEAGEPGVEVLALGAYTATLFLKKTGNKDVRLYWKLFKRDTGGTETEILQSAVSDYLTADNSQYLISAYLNEDQTLDPTERLVLKLYANVSGTGTDVTVTLTMEGDYDSRLTINVLSSAFNLDRLSDVTVSAPADNELLAYDSGSGKWINQTPGEAGVLAADGSVPLEGDLNADRHSINNLLSWGHQEHPYRVSATEFGDPYSDIGDSVNKAIEYIKSTLGLPGGTVIIPAGEWPQRTTIVLKDGITLRGAVPANGPWGDRAATVIRPAPGYDIDSITDEPGVENFCLGIFNLCLRGDNQTDQPSPEAWGIHIYDVKGLTIAGCGVREYGTGALKIEDINRGFIYANSFCAGTSSANRKGNFAVYLAGGGDSLFWGNEVSGLTTYEGGNALRCHWSTSILFGNKIYYSGTGSSTGVIFVTNSAQGLKVFGNYINSGSVGIRIDDVDNCEFSGNTIESCPYGISFYGACNDSLFVANSFIDWNDDGSLLKGFQFTPSYSGRGNRFIGNQARGGDIIGGSPAADDYFSQNDPEYFDLDTTGTLAGGGTASHIIPNSTVGDRVEAYVVPNNDPGNNVGFRISKIWWDDSASAIKVEVEETENAGGGEYHLYARRIPR